MTIFQLLLISVTVSTMYGQARNTIDSLKHELEISTTDTAKISQFNKLAKAYFIRGDSISAFQNGYRSLQLAENTSVPPYYKALGHQIMGYLHTITLHTDSAIYYNSQVLAALKKPRSIEEIRLVAYAKNNLASNYHVSGRPRKAAELLIDNLPKFEELKDFKALAGTLQNITATFSDLGDYEKAEYYVIKTISVLEAHNFPLESKVTPYITGAFLMYKMDQLPRMKDFLDKAKANLDQLGSSNVFRCRYYAYMARYYVKTKQLEEAKKMLELAERELEKFPIRTNYYDVYNARFDLAIYRKDLVTARDVALKLYTMSIQDDYSTSALEQAIDVASLSAEIGDHRLAYEFQKRSFDLSDSLKSKEMQVEIQELETRYQASEKEKRIVTLENEKREAALTSRNQFLLNLVLGVGAALFLMGMVFLSYLLKANKKKSKNRLAEAQRDQALKVSQALLEGEDRERVRIARDLHDGIGGTLSGIKMKLSDPSRDKRLIVQEAELQLGVAIDELRRTARGMVPESLLKNGLEIAVQDLCAHLANTGVKIEFQSSGGSRGLLMHKAIHIYRIVQELLTNAIKHGSSKNILVQFIRENETFLITVDDDGRGFDVGKQITATGIGLQNIRNRVSFLKGKLSIESAPGMGTSINIELNI